LRFPSVVGILELKMNKLTKFENMIFEGCKTSPLRVNGNNKYKTGGKKRGMATT
jgi:hypothetical protein